MFLVVQGDLTYDISCNRYWTSEANRCVCACAMRRHGSSSSRGS